MKARTGNTTEKWPLGRRNGHKKPDPFAIEFGRRVAQARVGRNLYQYELAEMVGFATPEAIANIERGFTTTTLARAARLSVALKTSLDKLVPRPT